MASMALPSGYSYYKNYQNRRRGSSLPCISLSQQHNNDEPIDQKSNHQLPRRDIILRSSELAVIGAIFSFSGKKPDYLGVQKNQPALALCPATKNCISTSENIADLTHYAPPWNYNGGRGRKNPVSREVAMKELLDVIKSTKPDKFTPRILEQKEDYVRVEYESPILGVS
ncbi:hypothetical protein HS088_TW18G00347 [Tripterygium wilfordii]|uniref:Uncharacterized protein n=1 Tax=Tripterygium wilfordii TaxID=458696 RepID=A0A7J7CC00_TRIWF|nr:hypothetical protein HS088_TW18G00347 [Tripterygium wilfordii]